MEYANIIYEFRDNIAFIKLNRPQAMNSLSTDLLNELSACFDSIAQDRSVLGVILTGEGKAFCAGADLTGNVGGNVSPNPCERTRDRIQFVHGVFNKIENCPRPVIAAVNGYALGGGCELSLVCDIRIAGGKAVFGFPEVGLGVVACYGGPQRLPRLIGAGYAKEMLYTGRKIDAATAEKYGLVNRVVAPEALMEEAEALMKEIIRQAPISVKYTKICVNRGLEVPLDYALGLELDMVAMAITTEDAAEGGKAFVERRAPVFCNQ